MTDKIKKYTAIITLAGSIAGGGSVIALNASNTIAATANAGQPSCDRPLAAGQWCP